MSAEVAEGVLQLDSSLLSPNIYLIGDLLIDAGTRRGAGKLLRQLRGRTLRALALTHVHPPTQGASARLCKELEIELWCGEKDVVTAETGRTAEVQPRHWINPLQQRLLGGSGHPVSRALFEGAEVGDFEVLEVPGHSYGHIALWRAGDRVLLLGDVLNNQNVWTGRTGLHEPPAVFTPEPGRNRESARRLAALEPRTVLFSHGPPLRGSSLREFVSKLED